MLIITVKPKICILCCQAMYVQGYSHKMERCWQYLHIPYSKKFGSDNVRQKWMDKHFGERKFDK